MFHSKSLAPVVQKLDEDIDWKNLCPLDKAICLLFVEIRPEHLCSLLNNFDQSGVGWGGVGVTTVPQSRPECPLGKKVPNC